MKRFLSSLYLGDLINIDPGRIERSRDVSIKYDNTYTTTDKPTSLLGKFKKWLGLKFISKTVRYIANGDYVVLIKVSPQLTYDKLLRNTAKVYCSCSDFKYRAAYDLNASNNLFLNAKVISELGIAVKEPPTKIMPTPACKHVYAATTHIKTNYKQVQLTP